MMKHKYWFLVVGILMILFLLLVSLVFAQNDYSGGTGITGTRVSEEHDNDPQGDDAEAIANAAADYPGQYLALHEFFDCHNIDRDGDSSVRVASASDAWSGFATVYSRVPILDADLRTLFNLPPFYDPIWYENYQTYAWTDLGYTYDVSLEITDDPRLYRFEGKADSTFSPFETAGCIIGAQFLHHVGFTYEYDETTQTLTHPGGIAFEADGQIPISIPTVGETAYEVYSGFSEDIVWDTDPDDCAIIGGEWLDTSNYDDNRGNYYQCCGDDYLWINNKPVTEEETGQELDIEYDLDKLSELDEDTYEYEAAQFAIALKYCLYSKDKDENILFPDVGDYVTCLPTEFHDYDEALEFAEEWSGNYPDECLDEEGNFLSTCSYIVVPFYDERTDIGKWSAMNYDGTTENPNLCRITAPLEETKSIPQFAWNDVNSAGDLPVDIEGNEITDLQEDHAETICEAYLGGTWTGAYCCGNKYDYPDDDYDYGHEEEYFGESFSDPTPIYWNPGDTENIYANYACVDGTTVNTLNTAEKQGSDGQIYELLNVEGLLYSCNIDNPDVLDVDYYTQETLIADGSNYDAAACDVKGEKFLCSYNPDAETGYSAWQWEDTTSSSYVFNTLLYSEDDTFTLSTATWASDEGYAQESACCAGNTCWDGDECAPVSTIYYYGEDVDSDGVGDEVEICSEGVWVTPTGPKYDWYYNTDVEGVTYCAHNYACVCSSNEDDETFCTENVAYLNAGCTLVENFYKDDHFCEAVYSDSDDISDSSRWTSRTKFLAFQLLEVAQAEGTDFTLFCDTYSTAINNYANLEPVEDDINSVCVLEQAGKVTLGITLNGDDEDEPMAVDANELLFLSGSKSIVPNILEENAINNCGAAISDESGERFGEFYSCDSSNTTWYNNNLSALIYSKAGLDYTTTINYPDIDGKQNDFDAYKETITTHITDASEAGTLVNPDGKPLSTYFAEFNNVHDYDYNTLYYNYDADSGNTIFGFQEIKYSENAGNNRYYLGVLYDGYTLDCDQVYAPYDTALPIYCNSGTGIVLERSTTGSEYWTDLTAAIRLE